MNREFLEFYDRELKILYERSKEFAEEFPGMAERLGALTADKIDPMIGGLLEGAAFLAARVQLKLKSEFDTFTIELIEQLLPGFLAPVPSFALVEAKPDYGNPALIKGMRIPAGQYIETTFTERERRVACRYRTTSEIMLWPYEVSAAEYYASAAPLQAQGLDCGHSVTAGLRIEVSLKLDREGAVSAKSLGGSVSNSPADELAFYLVAPTSDAVLLYEQLFSRLNRIVIRYLDDLGDPRFFVLDRDVLQPLGFEPGESLFGHDDRFFGGFNYLREYFAFPAKYLGFRIRALASRLKKIGADRFELMFEFTGVAPRLASVTKKEWFSLYSSPAANLFEIMCAPVPIRSQDHEHAVIPDRSRTLDYEVYRILDVSAHFPRQKDKVPVFPIYSAPNENTPLAHALYYASRRIERRKTDKERRSGSRSSYLGTETFITLKEPISGTNGESVRNLTVRAIVTNRHLTDQLPVRRGVPDFFLVEDTSVTFDCVAGPTSPKESMLTGERRDRGGETTGALLWKLISLLQFNHLGLASRPGRQGANALHELLMIFADAANPVIERQIRGIVDVSTRSVVRKVRRGDRYDAARGLEISVVLDENAFEGQGAFLFGLVLSRFFTEYASPNTFVETSIISKQRGAIKRWQPEIGRRVLL